MSFPTNLPGGAVAQWVLPPIGCPATNGVAAPFTIEIRIQKSRRPLYDNLVGIYDATVNYRLIDGVGDVVYYGGTPWRSLQDNNTGHTPATGSAWWVSATNFDFAQSDYTTVFYLDQQIIAEDGLGMIARSVSRAQGLLTPDARTLKLIDFTSASGYFANASYAGQKSHATTTVALTDLSATTGRTLLNTIFDEPDAYYTFFFSRVTGVGYSTNRELYYIGDCDFSKSSAAFSLQFHPGKYAISNDTVQKGQYSIQLESIANRLNTFTVRDLILSVALSDLGDPQPFIGGMTQVPTGSDPNWGPSSAWVGRQGKIGWAGDLKSSEFPGGFYLCYNHSRADTRLRGSYMVAEDHSWNTNMEGTWGSLGIATSSINDDLHFILLTTILSKIFTLVNFTWDASNLQTKLSFWQDYVISVWLYSNAVALADLGLCYESTFGIDPRCNLNIAEMPGTFSWNDTLATVLRRLGISLSTFIKTNYDQTNYRAENVFADAYFPTANPLPSVWQPGAASLEPRLLTARRVEVNNAGDSDKFSCPRQVGTSLAVENTWRAKKLGELGQKDYDPTVDIIHNANLPVDQQWQTFAPFKGGLLDGGHVVGRSYDQTWGSSPGTIALIAGGPLSTGAQRYYLTDSDHEFVIAQVRRTGPPWFEGNDVDSNPHDYLILSADEGNADVICVWTTNSDGNVRCIYGVTSIKYSRNGIYFDVPGNGQNGQLPITAPWTLNNAPYVVGYTGFGMDLATTDGSDLVTSATYDFYNFDALGNGHVGQTIVIPGKGVYTIINNFSGTRHQAQLDRAVIGTSTNLEFRIGGPQPNSTCMIQNYWFYEQTANVVLNTQVSGGDQTVGSFTGYADWFYPCCYLGAGNSNTTCWKGCYTISRVRYVDGVIYDGPKLASGTHGVANGTTTFVDATANAFTASMVNNSLYIGTGGSGGIFTIAEYVSASTVLLSGDATTGTGLSWQVGGNVGGVAPHNAPDDSFGNSLKTFAQTQAAINLGSLQLTGKTFIGVRDATGSLVGYGPTDTYAEYSQGLARTYLAQTLLIDEKHGVVHAKLLETTKRKALSDANYPVIKTGTSTSGAGGTGGGIGATGGSSTNNPASGTTLGVQTIAIFSATQNDLLIGPTSGFIRISSSVSTKPYIDITGLQGGANGRIVTFVNVGSNPIIFTNQDTGSIAADRFQLVGNLPRTLLPNMELTVWYDSTSGYWREKGQ